MIEEHEQNELRVLLLVAKLEDGAPPVQPPSETFSTFAGSFSKMRKYFPKISFLLDSPMSQLSFALLFSSIGRRTGKTPQS